MNSLRIATIRKERRRFLKGAAAVAVTGLASSQSLSLWTNTDQLPGSIVGTALNPMCPYLDVEAAESIATQFEKEEQSPGLDILDLSDYGNASIPALQRLSGIEAGFAFLGFESLDMESAEQLANWISDFLCFSSLLRLNAGTAAVLSKSEHSLAFPKLTILEVETATWLSDCRSLDIGLSELSTEIANALSLHRHELSLHIPKINSDVVTALSTYQGHRLEVRTRHPFPEPSLIAFSGDSERRLTVTNGSYSDTGCAWWNLLWKLPDYESQDA